MKHAEIQNRYKNHIFLSYRETGGSRSLTGDVIVIVFSSMTVAVSGLKLQKIIILQSMFQQ